MGKLTNKVVEKIRTDGIVSTVRAGKAFISHRLGQRVKPHLQRGKFKLYELGYYDIDDLYGTEYYDYMRQDGGQADANRFGELLIDRYEPSSVIDLGCGIGRFLKPFHDSDIDVFGIDASEYAVSTPVVDGMELRQGDLTQPLDLDRTSDIVLCVEVLEHLPPESASTAVETISEAAPIAIISIARPGQGGDYHLNEQPLEYWVDKFEAVEMTYDESETEFLRENIDPDELEWLSKNIAVFRRPEQLV